MAWLVEGGLLFKSVVLLISNEKSEYYTGLCSEGKKCEVFEDVPFFYENFSMMGRIKGISLYFIA